MPRGKLFFIILVVIFAMTATTNAQPASLPEKVEVSALTPTVKSLMEEADKAIAETTNKLLAANQRLSKATSDFEAVLAKKNPSVVGILTVQTDYLAAISDKLLSVSTADRAIHKVVMAYIGETRKIIGDNLRPAPDSYREWRKAASAATAVSLPPEIDTLMAKSKMVLEAAEKREKLEFDRLLNSLPK